MKKYFALILLVLMVISSLPVYASTNSDIKIYVDNKQVVSDQNPFINEDGRTMVPVRFVSEALGADVNWLPLDRAAVVEYAGTKIVMVVGMKYATVGLSIKNLDSPVTIVGGRTMVPLRFVSECLGAQVRWDASERAVYITTSEMAKDDELVDSDLILKTPSPGNNENNVNLIAIVDYRFNRPVEPQITDLQEILKRRFTTEEIKPIIDYIRTKKGMDGTHIPVKDWTINGKLVRVSDNIASITVTVWNQ